MQMDWGLWSGGAAAGATGDYLDVKTTPLSTRVTNSELFAGAILATQVMNLREITRRPFYNQALNGAAGWATGMLTAGILRRRLLPATTTAPAAATTTATKSVPSASAQPGGVTGVPASGGSAAFDLPAGGY